MIVHETAYLEVFFDQPNDLFIQTWKLSPKTNIAFKGEMLKFVHKYKEYSPSKALWLHENFKFMIDLETKKWTEKNVIVPCVKAGNKKLAFVVSENIFSHLSVLDSFKGTKIDSPKHFPNKSLAMEWISSNTFNTLEDNVEPYISFNGIDEQGNVVLKFKTNSETSNLLKSLKSIIEVEKFKQKNYLKFLSLTKREKEVLFKYIHGESLNTISDSLYISIYTTRTHWRSIKRKLKIQSNYNLIKYLCYY